MKNSNSGDTAFTEYYAEIYGSRWPALKNALLGEPSYASIAYDGHEAYHLDSASKIAAESLDASPGMRIADLCAAPGGKTLVLAGALDGRGTLVANERSRQRRERLKRVISEHLPSRLRDPIDVTGHDASRWCLYETDAYDAVLLDVPCSAEKHLIARPSKLNRWTTSRTKRLAAQSYAMLASALEIVHIGGFIVFSTCTISPTENDGVVERLRKKREGRFEIATENAGIGEETTYGRIVLPDRSDGSGPLYFARLRRIR